MEDIVVGYPPPKPNSSRKEHIFTEKDKEAGDSRAKQVLKSIPPGFVFRFVVININCRGPQF